MADHIQDAERALLCAMLTSQPAAEVGLGLVGPGEFKNALHGEIWQAIREQSAASAYDAGLVVQRLAAGGSKATHLVPDITTIGTPPAATRQYATVVQSAARKRQLWMLGQRLVQASEQMDGDDLIGLASRVATEVDEIADGTDDTSAIPDLHELPDFAETPDDPQSWVVPNLLEVGDSVMLLAGEGVGKSTISRMMCLALASGVHPFHPRRRIPPQRTLLVDLENAAGTVRRDTRAQIGMIRRFAGEPIAPGMSWVWHYRRGLNLRKPSHAQLLERVIARTGPRLVAMGSLYKAFTQGSDSYEAAAQEVREVLDRLSGKYDFCWWLENHMPKGDGVTRPKVPFGASEWMKWAGYGKVLDPITPEVYELQSYRGDRETGREWPAGLRRGGELRWTAVDPEELEMERQIAKRNGGGR